MIPTLLSAVVFLLESLALLGTWDLKLKSLRAFLIYEIFFDVSAFAVLELSSGFVYWYFYWIGRTLGFVFLALVAANSPAMHRLPCRMNLALHCTLVAILVAVTLRAWLALPPNNWQGHLQKYSVVAAIVCGFMVLITATMSQRQSRHLLVSAGLLTWCLSSGISGSLNSYHFSICYPLASTIPLLIWSACLIGKRGRSLHESTIVQGHGGTEAGVRQHHGLQEFHGAIQ